MGIFDRLRGRSNQPAEEDPAAAAAAAAVSPSLDLDVGRQTETLHDPSRTISTEVTPGVSFRREEQTRLYNPYDGRWNVCMYIIAVHFGSALLEACHAASM